MVWYDMIPNDVIWYVMTYMINKTLHNMVYYIMMWYYVI